jgi:hypothetical protein
MLAKANLGPKACDVFQGLALQSGLCQGDHGGFCEQVDYRRNRSKNNTQPHNVARIRNCNPPLLALPADLDQELELDPAFVARVSWHGDGDWKRLDLISAYVDVVINIKVRVLQTHGVATGYPEQSMKHVPGRACRIGLVKSAQRDQWAPLVGVKLFVGGEGTFG